MSWIRPTDLPEVRDEMMTWLESTVGRSWFEDYLSEGEEDTVHDTVGSAALRLAELYYVSPEMAELARHAAQSLPDFTLQREDLPSSHGFLYSPAILFEPVMSEEQSAGQFFPTPFHGLLWSPAPGLTNDDGKPISAMFISPVTERDEYLQRNESPIDLQGLTPRVFEFKGRMVWEFDNPEADDGGNSVESMGPNSMALTVFKAMWLLMAQPIARIEDAVFDRVTTRRLARRDIPPTKVRVITLRRPKGMAADSDAGREYHHQWVVRGHWRQQWYPAREVHRPVWINPHIKGPEGAPLLTGEKVYHWKQ